MRAQQSSRAVRVDITTLLDLKNSCDNSCGTSSACCSGRFARVAAGIAIGVGLIRAKILANAMVCRGGVMVVQVWWSAFESAFEKGANSRSWPRKSEQAPTAEGRGMHFGTSTYVTQNRCGYCRRARQNEAQAA